MIDRRSLVLAGLCVGWQSIFDPAEAAGGSLQAEAESDGCHEIADEIDAQASSRMFDPSTERLSWAPRLSGN